jgi:hypothetical protein
MKTTAESDKINNENVLLWPFLNFAEQGEDVASISFTAAGTLSGSSADRSPPPARVRAAEQETR